MANQELGFVRWSVRVDKVVDRWQLYTVQGREDMIFRTAGEIDIVRTPILV